MISHIFVDFENIQPTAQEVAAANSSDIRLWILHGAHQRDFSSDLVRAWQPMGVHAFFVQSSKTGPNAVDMLLAFCLGEAYQVDRAAKQDARYIVVSKDKDFDALTLHMKQIGMAFHRVPALSKALALVRGETHEARVPAIKPTTSAVPATRGKPSDVERVIEDLRMNARNRPKRRSTLEHKLLSFLGGKVAPKVVHDTIAELERRGIVRFDATKVSYKFG